MSIRVLHFQTLYKWENVRPHQCCCLPAAEKTYCSAALISSPRAAFFLLHHAHQHAHRPLGAQLFGILQVSIGYCFLPFGASFEVYGLCFLFTNLTFPLPRSVFTVSRHSGYFIKGIASPKLPCELWSETDRAFQAVRPCSLEPAFFFNSYHLDRFGHSVLASLVSLQDISSVTIGLTSFKRFGFRHLFRKVSGGCRPGL